MKVRLRANPDLVGESTKFDKSELHYLFVDFLAGPTAFQPQQSVSAYDLEIFLEQGGRWMPFLSAIRSGLLLFSGAPDRHFVEP